MARQQRGLCGFQRFENEKFLEYKIWLTCFNFFSFSFCCWCGVKTIRSRNITEIEAVCQITNDSDVKNISIYLYSWRKMPFSHQVKSRQISIISLFAIWCSPQSLGSDFVQVCPDVMMMFILVGRSCRVSPLIRNQEINCCYCSVNWYIRPNISYWSA